MLSQSQPEQPSSNNKSLIAVSALTGAAIAGTAIHFFTRGRAASSSISNHASILQMLLRLEQAVSASQQQTARSLQSQEIVIQKSLQPVAATQQQLSSIHTSVDQIKNIFQHPKSRGNFGEFQLESLIRSSMAVGEHVLLDLLVRLY
jgi:DNA anti-recombination protein RmuC